MFTGWLASCFGNGLAIVWIGGCVFSWIVVCLLNFGFIAVGRFVRLLRFACACVLGVYLQLV